MKEAQQVSNQNPMTQTPTIATYPTPQPVTNSKASWLVAVIILLVGIASYFGYQYYQLRIQLDSQISAPSLSGANSTSLKTSPDTKSTSMIDWETYTDSTSGLTFKHPQSWRIEIIKNNNSQSNALGFVIKKDLPNEAINSQYCTPELDCFPYAQIKLFLVSKPENFNNIYFDNYCDLFTDGCSANNKIELYRSTDNNQYRLEYGQISSLYPTQAFFVFRPQNIIMKASTWMPSSKNCEGKCPEYIDSDLIIQTAQEAIKILSTFQLTK